MIIIDYCIENRWSIHAKDALDLYLMSLYSILIAFATFIWRHETNWHWNQTEQ